MRNKVLLSILIIIIIGAIGTVEVNYNSNKSDQIEELEEVTEEEKVDIRNIEIMAVGDFLIHKEILETQYNQDTDSYNFDNTIKYVKKYFEEADLSIANLETPLAGKDNFGYSGYPSFNTPDELADTMKNAGIDIIANMNNHILDRDVRGFRRNSEFIREKGFDVIGVKENYEDKGYIVKDVNGINIGITSYGYTMTTADGVRGINGLSIPSDMLPLLNTFHPDDLEKDLENMKNQIDAMREEGAETIVFYMHWGDEYELEPNDIQKRIAQFLANEKVDIVFGTHPHSLQPIDILKSEDGTSETIVVYSMGNFLSSQRTERIENPYTEDGVMVFVNISKNMDTKEVKVDNVSYLPTWVNWYQKEGKYYYEVVPATINSADYLTEEGQRRVDESFDRTKSIIERYKEVEVKELQ